MSGELRVCLRCGLSKSPEAFRTLRKSGGLLVYLRRTCRLCERPTNTEKIAIKNRLANYGISHKEYLARWNLQGGVCAICGRAETKRVRGTPASLAVDHVHETGEIRGLLCSRCNTALGLFGDDPEILRNAIVYIEIHARFIEHYPDHLTRVPEKRRNAQSKPRPSWSYAPKRA